MPDHAADAVALWSVHTFLLDIFQVTPRLAIYSAVKGCGKTTLIDVLSHLVYRPQRSDNVTAAAIFRLVEKCRPALLVDEADTFLRDSEDLRGILNSGHRKGGTVIRTVGDDFEPRAFSTYAACAVALIGKLPDTLHDRSIVVSLQRKRPDERVREYRVNCTSELDTFSQQGARWAADNAIKVGRLDPNVPSRLFNRAADNWRGLLSIADAAGGEWPERARNAATLMQEAAGDDDNRIRLLADIRTAFDEAEVGQLPSTDLAGALGRMEGSPWAEYGTTGKPITPNRLARLLKAFKVAPSDIWWAGKALKGYHRDQFEGLFSVYIPDITPPQPRDRETQDISSTYDSSQPRGQKSTLADEKCEKPNNDRHSRGLAVVEGVSRAKGVHGGNICAHCGEPSYPGSRLLECWVDGVQSWGHEDCLEQAWRDWPGMVDMADELAAADDGLDIPEFLRRT
jgi:hypothetical protein